MHSFRTYHLAVQFYRTVRTAPVPGHLRNQLLRAASSIPLNLAEGRGKFTLADRKRFYRIAFGSIREVQAVFDIVDDEASEALRSMLDHLAGATYLLIKNAK